MAFSVYLEFGPMATDEVTLTFTIDAMVAVRMWDLKTSQMTCTDVNRYVN